MYSAVLWHSETETYFVIRHPLPRISPNATSKASPRCVSSSSPRRLQRIRHSRGGPGASLALTARGANEEFPVSGSLQRSRSNENRSGISGLGGVSQPSRPGMSMTAGFEKHEWAVMQEIEARDFQHREEEKRSRQLQMRHEHTNKLNEQRARVLQEKDECNLLQKRWRDEIEADAARYQQEEQGKKASMLEYRRRFDQERKEQLEERKGQLEQKMQAEKSLGLEMLRMANEASRKAEAQEERRKRLEREQAMKMVEQATTARVIKQQLKEQE
ncbi:unnamed protein product, partial [Polarella glacialis]